MYRKFDSSVAVQVVNCKFFVSNEAYRSVRSFGEDYSAKDIVVEITELWRIGALLKSPLVFDQIKDRFGLEDLYQLVEGDYFSNLILMQEHNKSYVSYQMKIPCSRSLADSCTDDLMNRTVKHYNSILVKEKLAQLDTVKSIFRSSGKDLDLHYLKMVERELAISKSFISARKPIVISKDIRQVDSYSIDDKLYDFVFYLLFIPLALKWLLSLLVEWRPEVRAYLHQS